MGACEHLSMNLTTLRALRHMSQVSFARELGISKSTLQEIEGGHGPSLGTLECIADHLELPAALLISEPLSPAQVDFLHSLLLGMDRFRLWPEEDLNHFLDLSCQLVRLLEKHHTPPPTP